MAELGVKVLLKTEAIELQKTQHRCRERMQSMNGPSISAGAGGAADGRVDV